MDFFDPSNKRATTREIARLTGENAVLRQAVVLLALQSADRTKLCAELRRDVTVLKQRAHDAYTHPSIEEGMQDMLDSICRMTGER